MMWIKVEDRLPEMMTDLPYSEDVLTISVSHGKPTKFGGPNAYRKDEKYACVDRIVKWNDHKEPSFRTNRFYGKVTHWMPLPEFPK